MLEGIFERNFSSWKLFSVLIIFNIKFNLALGMTRIESFLDTDVSLVCLYYFHTKVCLQTTSGDESSHIETSKLICKTN